MPFVPTIKPPLDAVRAIGGLLGLRVFAVTVRKRVWTGTPANLRPPAPGAAGMTATDTDVVLTNQAADGSLQPVMVRQVSRREAIASGGQYTARDLRVGPMTPAYAANLQLGAAGQDDSALNPAPTASPTEIIWILKTNDGGTHGLPAAGVICEKVGEESTAIHYIIFLRATGCQPM